MPLREDTLAIETTYGLTFPKAGVDLFSGLTISRTALHLLHQDAEQLKERLGADRAAQAGTQEPVVLSRKEPWHFFAGPWRLEGLEACCG